MKKTLGQNFLVNKTAIKKIVAVLNLQPKDTIIEIGPGQGALTFPLVKQCRRLDCEIIAIEKDPVLANQFKIQSASWRTKFKIIEGDALKVLPILIGAHHSLFKIQNLKLVGNIPYYITGQLLRIISELKIKPSLTVLMLQKEVAERIIAEPPKMNLLAAAVQIWAEPKIIFTLKPDNFKPRPKVESAVIKLTAKITNDPMPTGRQELPMTNYYRMIHIIFKQPRKTLFNNLRQGLKTPKYKIEKALKTLKINPQSRPQNLSVAQLKELAELFTF